jgi:BirA family biotin operon repressor/biotin-[acetyl-CoA-carboxylase] ligase
MKFEILHFSLLASTNNHLFDIVSKQRTVEGLVITTDFQTDGKGLGTNKWESQQGKNLNFSLLLSPEFLKPEQQFAITQIISLSIINVCNRKLNNENVCIKWPNDIYVGNKKLAGVLVQNVIKGNSISDSVVGIGLNVNQKKFISDAPNPVSLIQLTNQEIDLKNLLKEILEEINEIYSRLRVFPDTKWLENKYLKNMYRFNQLNYFTDKNGKFEGKIIGIDKYGQLKIKKTDEQTVVYAYKEVEFNI